MKELISKTKQELRIALCEDIEQHLLHHREVLSAVVQKMDTSFVLYRSAEELLEGMDAGAEFDVLFLDIEMGGMDGIEAGKRAKNKNSDLILIYLTAYRQYALRAYETRAFRYLLKPFDEKEAEGLMKDIYKEINAFHKLIFRDREKTYFIEISKVIYLEARNKTTFAYTEDAEYSGQISLAEYEKYLEDYGFFRIHRKYLVNSFFIKELRSDSLIVEQDIELPIARNQRKLVKQMFMDAMERGIC